MISSNFQRHGSCFTIYNGRSQLQHQYHYSQVSKRYSVSHRVHCIPSDLIERLICAPSEAYREVHKCITQATYNNSGSLCSDHDMVITMGWKGLYRHSPGSAICARRTSYIWRAFGKRKIPCASTMQLRAYEMATTKLSHFPRR